MLWSLSVFVSWSLVVFFFFKQKTAYEMRISDWSSDVCRPAETAKPAGRSAWPTKAVPRHCSGQCRHSGENHRRQSLGMTNEQNLSRLFHSRGGASNAASGTAAILRGLLLEHDHAPPRCLRSRPHLACR